MHNIEKKKNKNPQNIKKKSCQEKCFAGPEYHSTPEDLSATPRHLFSAANEERKMSLAEDNELKEMQDGFLGRYRKRDKASCSGKIQETVLHSLLDNQI